MFRLPAWLFGLLIFLATKTNQGLNDVHEVYFWVVGTFALCDIVQLVHNAAVYVQRPNNTIGQPGYFDTQVSKNTKIVYQLGVDRSQAAETIYTDCKNTWVLRGGEEERYFAAQTPCSNFEHWRTSCVQFRFKTNYEYSTSKGRENAEAANSCLMAVFLITAILTGMKPDGFSQDDNTDLLLMLSWAVMLWMQHIFEASCEATVVFNSLCLAWVLFNRIMVSTNNGFVFVLPLVIGLMHVPCFQKACVIFFRLNWSYVIFNVTFCCFTVTLFLAKFMIQASRVVKSSVHDHRYVLIAAGVLIFMAFITVERKVQVYWSLLAKLFRSKIFGWKVWIPGGLISTAMQTALHCMSDQDCFQQVMDYCENM